MQGAGGRVLVTGLGGFTGRYLASVLEQRGYEVHGTVRAGEPSGERGHVADLQDATGLRHLIDELRPRHVVHLAAVAFVAHDDVDEIYRTNIVGTRNLLQALAAPGPASSVRTVLLASSANVYGNADVEAITEDQPHRPANDYAVSKSAMEQMAALWSERVPLTIVRPFNYTGPGQSLQFLIPKIIDAFARRAPSLELGNIDVARDFSDVRDVVQAYAQLLDLSPRGTFNVCSGRSCSLREVLELAERFSGHRPAIQINPAFVRSNEVRTLRGSPERLRQVLADWSPRPLAETVSWMIEVARARESAVRA